MNLALRDFLEQREKALTEQIADLHRHLAPLEAELAEIRRAKASIGMPGPGMFGMNFGETFGVSSELSVNLETSSGETHQQPLPLPSPAPQSPYAALTMKQLVT